jgi:hypothetical protein
MMHAAPSGHGEGQMNMEKTTVGTAREDSNALGDHQKQRLATV